MQISKLGRQGLIVISQVIGQLNKALIFILYLNVIEMKNITSFGVAIKIPFKSHLT